MTKKPHITDILKREEWDNLTPDQQWDAVVRLHFVTLLQAWRSMDIGGSNPFFTDPKAIEQAFEEFRSDRSGEY